MKKIIIFIFLTFFLSKSSFADTTQYSVSDLSIKELNENIEKLKEEKLELQEKTQELLDEYGKLVSFIKLDLTVYELEGIEKSINSFIGRRIELEKELKQKSQELLSVEEEKKELILLRANFFKYLANYVSFEKREEFLEYIKVNVQSEKESKDLVEEIIKNQFMLDQKVSYIKEKIEEHKESLQAKIEVSVTSKLRERIQEIDADEKYKNISAETKNAIYRDFITKVKEKIEEIDDTNLTKNYKDMRKSILSKLVEEIEGKIQEENDEEAEE